MISAKSSPVNQGDARASRAPLPISVAVFTSFLAPYNVGVFEALQQRVRNLTVLLCTEMESNRAWQPNFGSLDVRMIRTKTIVRPPKHSLGFRDHGIVHFPRNAGDMLAELQPDVVISSELGMRSVASARYRRKHPDSRLILWQNLSEHTERERGWLRHWLRRWLLPKADAVTANGPSGERYLQRMGVPRERLFRVPYAAVPHIFDQVPLERDPQAQHRLLHLGRLIDLKGVMPFLQALIRHAQQHPQRNLEFWLAGDGPVRKQIEAVARPRNLSITLLGDQPYERLGEICQQCGILAYPTLFDEWGLVVNEALAAGLPVLGSLYSQAVETHVIPGKTGWTFRTDHPAEMDRAIATALETSPDALNKMRSAGRHEISHVTPDYAADGFLAAICSVWKQPAT